MTTNSLYNINHNWFYKLTSKKNNSVCMYRFLIDLTLYIISKMWFNILNYNS